MDAECSITTCVEHNYNNRTTSSTGKGIVTAKKEAEMSEHIDLHSGEEIRDWMRKNGFDIVRVESEDAPRFFQPRFTPTSGTTFLFSIEHTYCTDEGRPMVSVKRMFRATSAEDALQQYLLEGKERLCGRGEQQVGFKLHVKPGSSDKETITVVKREGD